MENHFRVRKPVFIWVLLVPMLCTIVLLNSCIPPVWDSFDVIYRVDSIKPGVTTKDEVIQKFGKPDAQELCDGSVQYTYTGTKSMGFLLIYPAGSMIKEKRWKVFICFDENNVVSSVSKVERGSMPLGGIHSSQHSHLLNFLDRENRDPEWLLGKEISTYCPNADLGHADAQLHIGDILYQGAYSRNADIVRAWVWYSLASQNGDEVAEAAVKRITAELTPEQIVEAKRQLAAWKPGQCAKDLSPDDR
jgi:hypothetical protein